MKFFIFMLLVSTLVIIFLSWVGGVGDKEFNYYSKENGGCELVGETNDRNGANAGGVASVFKCGNGKYYIK